MLVDLVMKQKQRPSTPPFDRFSVLDELFLPYYAACAVLFFEVVSCLQTPGA